MANIGAHNGNLPPKILIWKAVGTDTPVVWKYTCPVDSHQLVSSVDLASGTVCPRHHAVLTGEGTVSVA